MLTANTSFIRRQASLRNYSKIMAFYDPEARQPSVWFPALPLTSCMAMDWKSLPSKATFSHLRIGVLSLSCKACWEAEQESAGNEAGMEPDVVLHWLSSQPSPKVRTQQWLHILREREKIYRMFGKGYQERRYKKVVVLKAWRPKAWILVPVLLLTRSVTLGKSQLTCDSDLTCKVMRVKNTNSNWPL